MPDTPLVAELLSQFWFRFLPLTAAPFLLLGVLTLGYGRGIAL